MNQREKRKRNIKFIILTAAAILAAVFGVWLLQSPNRERQADYDNQEALMYAIMQDIWGIDAIDDYYIAHLEYFSEPTEPTDYLPLPQIGVTNGMDAEDEEIPTNNEAPYTPDYENGEYEAFYFEHLPDSAFPNAVQGIGILTIERINLNLPIAEGVEYATLRIAPGRVLQTARIGEIGNAVIAGHRNYTFGSMFNRLDELEIGDIVQYQARNGEMMEFEVFEIAVIEPHDQIAFLQPVNDSIITLYTCTPTRTATHRLIIRAQRIY